MYFINNTLLLNQLIILMKKKLFLILFCAGLTGLTGCEKEKQSDASGQNGKFTFALNTDGNLSVKSQTDGNTAKTIDTPEAGDFSVKIKDNKGNTVKAWDRASDIPEDISLVSGTYSVTAVYGEKHTGAFEKPCFSGESNFVITDGTTTTVNIECSLSNVMTTAGYTKGFKNYFKDYSISMTSSGSPVIFNKEESRAAFFEPGNLSVIANLVKQDGTEFSFSPASLTDTKARDYYNFTFDVENGAGGAQLIITFDEETIKEPITIDLNQDWLTKAKPFSTLTGFTSEENIDIASGETPTDENNQPRKLSILATAREKIGSYTIAHNSALLAQSGWPQSVDLTTADENTKSKLRSLGLKWTETLNGLNMAVIDFSNVPSFLPSKDAGSSSYEFIFTCKDKINQAGDPVKLNINVQPPKFTLSQPVNKDDSSNPVYIGNKGAAFPLLLEAGNIEKIKLKYYDEDWSVWKDAPFTFSKKNNEGSYSLIATIDFLSKNVRVKATYDGSNLESEVSVDVQNCAILLDGPYQTTINSFKQIMVYEMNGQLISPEFISKVEISKTDGASWTPATFKASGTFPVMIEITGLESEQNYKIRAYFDAGIGEIISANTVAGKTKETQEQLPDGSFESAWSNHFSENINKGGICGGGTDWANWGGKWKDQEKQQLTAMQAASPWTTVNAKTVPTAPSTKNIWYMVPSAIPVTDAHDGAQAVMLRNVAWSNNSGNPPDGDKKKDQSLSDLTPPSLPHRSAGKLFLGSYTAVHANGGVTETYNEGYAFTSKPKSMTFWYKYTSAASGEQGFVQIEVERREGSTVTSLAKTIQNLPAVAQYTQVTVPLTGYPDGVKSSHIKVMFSSSDKCSYTQSQEDGNIKTNDNRADCISTGSVLYIDNIRLNY